ncbi:hypothetical protein ACVIHD_001497 [Bradyrhizobium embrapense]
MGQSSPRSTMASSRALRDFRRMPDACSSGWSIAEARFSTDRCSIIRRSGTSSSQPPSSWPPVMRARSARTTIRHSSRAFPRMSLSPERRRPAGVTSANLGRNPGLSTTFLSESPSPSPPNTAAPASSSRSTARGRSSSCSTFTSARPTSTSRTSRCATSAYSGPTARPHSAHDLATVTRPSLRSTTARFSIASR